MGNSYVTMWAKFWIRRIQLAQDKGPLEVIFGAPHISLPSISHVVPGDRIYPIFVNRGAIFVIACHSTLQTQLLPERVQGVDIAERLGADELDIGNRRRRPAESSLQAADQRFEVLRPQLVEPAEVGDDPLPGFPVVITKGLDELQVSPPAGLGDARKHAATVVAAAVDIKT